MSDSFENKNKEIKEEIKNQEKSPTKEGVINSLKENKENLNLLNLYMTAWEKKSKQAIYPEKRQKY